MTKATRPTTITCARCGNEKAVGRTGPIPTYCSAGCRAALGYDRSRQDGRYERRLKASRQRAQEEREANATPCPYCGAPMTNRRRVQCGLEACRLRAAADRMRQLQRDYRAEHGVWMHHRYPESQRAATLRRLQKYGHWRKQYPERAAAYDARRRALVVQARTDEMFAPLDVHTRDGWTCQLCHEPIDPSITWPHSKSPSIDHVIPLSRGGAHAMANVQSAHLGCNSSKGDKLMDEVIQGLRGEPKRQ